jgi:hypothetical protein
MNRSRRIIEFGVTAAALVLTASFAWAQDVEPLPRNCCAYHTCGDTTVQACLGQRCPAGRVCTALNAGCEPSPYVQAGCIPPPV